MLLPWFLSDARSLAAVPIGSEASDEDISTREKFVRFLGRFVRDKNKDTFIAARLWDLNHGKLSDTDCLAFLKEIGKFNAGSYSKITMTDLVRVQTAVYDLAIKRNDPKIAALFFGREVTKDPGGDVKTGGTEVERALLLSRRKLLDSAISHAIRSAGAAIRSKPERFSVYVAFVGSHPETFAGDEDVNFLSNDPDAAELIRQGTEAHIRSVVGMGSEELDSILTIHGQATPAVYIGPHGCAYGREALAKNLRIRRANFEQEVLSPEFLSGEVVLEEMTREDAAKSAEAKVIEAIPESQSKEPGLSMEMARHLKCDIIDVKAFDPVDSIIKACKYLTRSNEALRTSGVEVDPNNQALCVFAEAVCSSKSKKDWRLLSKNLQSFFPSGTFTYTTFSEGGKLRAQVSSNEAAVSGFMQQVMAAIWNDARASLNQRVATIEAMKSRVTDVEQANPDEINKVREEMRALLDMMKAENALLPAKGVEVPDDIISTTENLQKTYDDFLARKGGKPIGPGDLKLEKAINEWIKSNQPSLKEMAKGYIVKALSTTSDDFNKAYSKLDIIDDALLGNLRGESADFDTFMAEAAKVDAAMKVSGNSASVASKLQSLKNSAIGIIGSTNRALNEKLAGSLAGRGTVGALKAFNIYQEVNALAEAMSTGSWRAFGTMLVKNHVPLVSASEALYVQEDRLRAAYELICNVFPPVAIPEGIYGMLESMGEWSVGKYHQWNYKHVVDDLYAGSTFDDSGKLESITYKCDVPSHGEHRCKTREEILDLPNQCPAIWKLFTPEVKEHPAIKIFEDMLKTKLVSDGEVSGVGWPKGYNGLSEKYGVELHKLYLLKVNQVTKKYFEGVIEELERRYAFDQGETYKKIIEIGKELGCSEPIAVKTGDSAADQKRFDEIILDYSELKNANEAIVALKTKWNAEFLEPFQPECSAESIKSCAKQAKELLEKLNEAQAIAYSDVKKIVGEKAALTTDTLRAPTKARLGLAFYPEGSSMQALSKEDYERALNNLRKVRTDLIAELSYPPVAYMGERVTIQATYDRPVDEYNIKWLLVDAPRDFKFIFESPDMVVFKPSYEGTYVIRLTAIEKKSGATLGQVLTSGGLHMLGNAIIKIMSASEAPEKIYLETPFKNQHSITEVGPNVQVPVSIAYESPPRPGYEYCKFEWMVNGRKVSDRATENPFYEFVSPSAAGSTELSVVAANKQQRIYIAKHVVTVIPELPEKQQTLKVVVKTVPSGKVSFLEGEQITLAASVAMKSGGSKATYHWFVNNSPAGDGTSVCKIDTTGQGGKSLKVEVLVQQALGEALLEGHETKICKIESRGGPLYVTLFPINRSSLPCGTKIEFEVMEPKYDPNLYTYEWFYSVDGNWSTVVLCDKPVYVAELNTEGQILQFKAVVTDKKGRRGEARTRSISVGPRVERLVVSVTPRYARIYENQTVMIRAKVKPFSDSGVLSFNGVKNPSGMVDITFQFAGKGREGLYPVYILAEDSKARQGEAVAEIFVMKGSAPSKTTKSASPRAGSQDGSSPAKTAVKPTEVNLGEPTKASPVTPGSTKTSPDPAVSANGDKFGNKPGEKTDEDKDKSADKPADKPGRTDAVLSAQISLLTPQEVMATDIFEVRATLEPPSASKFNWSPAPFEQQGAKATFQFPVDSAGNREIACTALNERNEVVASRTTPIPVKAAYVCGTIPTTWGSVTSSDFMVNRKTDGQEFPVRASVTAKLTTATAGSLKASFDSALSRYPNAAGQTRALTVGDFKGSLKELPDLLITSSPGSVSGSIVHTFSAGGYGFAQKGGCPIEVFYNVTATAIESHASKKSNTLEDLRSQAKAALSEVKAIIDSLRVSSARGINVVQTAKDETVKATVRLRADKQKVKANEQTIVEAFVDNAAPADEPLQYTWTGNHEGSGSKVRFLASKGGAYTLSVAVSGKLGAVGNAEVKIEVEQLQANLTGVPKQIYYGQSANIAVEIPALKISGVVAKKPVDQSTVFATDKEDDEAASELNVIWHAEPSVEFKHPNTSNASNEVTFSRAGPVKLWAQIELGRGSQATLIETPQVVTNVQSPSFRINFNPPNGAKPGQEIVATVSENPVVKNPLISFKWDSPPSNNRMEMSDNARCIKFKLKDKPQYELLVQPEVPYYRDSIGGPVKATYQGSSYSVKASVEEIGPKPQVWDPIKKGLVEMAKGTFATGERIHLIASLVGEPKPDEIRWSWSVSDGTSISNNISSTPTISRSEPGSAVCSVTARDKDGTVLGADSVTISVFSPEPVPTKSPDEQTRVKQAAKIAGDLAQHLADAKFYDQSGQHDKAAASAEAASKLAPSNQELANYVQSLKTKAANIPSITGTDASIPTTPPKDDRPVSKWGLRSTPDNIKPEWTAPATTSGSTGPALPATADKSKIGVPASADKAKTGWTVPATTGVSTSPVVPATGDKSKIGVPASADKAKTGWTVPATTGVSTSPAVPATADKTKIGSVGPHSYPSVVGKWTWFTGGNVELYPNGTLKQATLSGSWIQTGNKLQITWSHGYYDKMVLSADGNKLSGYGSRSATATHGFTVWGHRIATPPNATVNPASMTRPDKSASADIAKTGGTVPSTTGGSTSPAQTGAKEALLGNWQFMNGLGTFYSNGTCRHSHGTTGTWTLYPDRTLRISWSNGWFNTLCLSKDGTYLKGFDSMNPHASSGRDVWARKL
jgi:hypothetical protein